MDRSDVINLISESRTQDDYGRWIATKTSKQVMCQVDSITRAEFFEGGRNGLNPEFKFTMFFGDYSGESIVEYQGKTYAVYRTYLRRTDIIELYVERKGGTNAIPVTPPTPPVITTWASVAGKKESEGPLKHYFDII